MTDMRQDEPILFVSDFVRRLRRDATNRRRLFRGQCTDKPLLPRIVRLANQKGIPLAQVTNIERRMLSRFRRESVPMLGDVGQKTDWELMSIAQHHGMPTRLLDWTANALAGLWFAVSTDPPAGETHGVVWVLEVDPAHEKTPKDNDDIFGLSRTYIFQPFHLDRRIVAQSAWFSVHRYAENKNLFLPLEEHTRFAKALRRFTVPCDRFKTLRQELRLLGISHASMFPDLPGLSADIQVEFIDSHKRLPTTSRRTPNP